MTFDQTESIVIAFSATSTIHCFNCIDKRLHASTCLKHKHSTHTYEHTHIQEHSQTHAFTRAHTHTLIHMHVWTIPYIGAYAERGRAA